MEDRIRVPGHIAAAPGDELELDELDQVAGGLARAWQTDEVARADAAPAQPVGTPIRG